MLSKNRHPLITGTILLTITGLISRAIGFYYRIYLTRLFGEEGMGIYQLLSPVLALSFSLTGAGFQTAISKIVAEYTASNKRSHRSPLLAGLSVSLPLSCVCGGILYYFAEEIAVRLLMEVRTAPMLRILAPSIPLSAVHACFNGYFYGKKKAGVPALSQLAEQLTRVGCVFFLAHQAVLQGRSPNISIAVWGLSVGELVSMLVAWAALKWQMPTWRDVSPALYRNLMGMVFPLTANRMVLNLLQSVESISIPAKLTLFGYTHANALSVYGVLTGMAMPLIFFPNALTGSMAVLLLPMISESYALGELKSVKNSVRRTIQYCALMGGACMLGFVLLGRRMGTLLFHSSLAGHFITTLGFICPFIYLDTTLSSILQGLGMAGKIFLMNACCLLLRLSFVLFMVPHYGIAGYLWGLLASQLLLCILYLLCLRNFMHSD